jgi:hypothetical protein
VSAARPGDKEDLAVTVLSICKEHSSCTHWEKVEAGVRKRWGRLGSLDSLCKSCHGFSMGAANVCVSSKGWTSEQVDRCEIDALC